MDKEISTEVSCLFCPRSMDDEAEDLRRMTSSYLRIHTAVCHVDNAKRDLDELNIYVCDGESSRGEFSICSPEIKRETVAVNEYVDHLEEDHPDQDIPFRICYKAGLSDLMAELSIFKSTEADESMVDHMFMQIWAYFLEDE